MCECVRGVQKLFFNFIFTLRLNVCAFLSAKHLSPPNNIYPGKFMWRHNERKDLMYGPESFGYAL